VARDYKKEYSNESPERRKKRAMRNKARRMMQRLGKVKKGDGKDVDHKNGNAMQTRLGNLRVVSAHTNRSYPRTKDAHKKNPTD
jgi:hypothetical protein